MIHTQWPESDCRTVSSIPRQLVTISVIPAALVCSSYEMSLSLLYMNVPGVVEVARDTEVIKIESAMSFYGS